MHEMLDVYYEMYYVYDGMYDVCVDTHNYVSTCIPSIAAINFAILLRHTIL